MRRPRHRSVFATALSRAAVPAALLATVLAAASPAAAATLQLAGPAGATVTVNGAMVGFLPLAEPLTMPPGLYEVTCEMPGRIPHHEIIRFERDDEWRHVTVRVLPYSRSTAVFSNLALAGLGPRYLGHSGRGWLYSAAEAGGLLTGLFGEMARSNAHKEYLLAMAAYGQAVNADEIATLRAAADAKYQDAADAADLRDLGLTVAVGAVVVSMLDSWFSFNAVTAGAGELPGGVSALDGDVPGLAAAGAPAASPSFHSALRLSF